jgi:hypothetical protein
VIAAILRDELPLLAEQAPTTPPELVRIIGRTLCKDRAVRYQTASDLLADLKQLQRDLEFASAGKNRTNVGVQIQCQER